ncbi:MAG: hypothetical protein WAU01_01390 [Saprospiraceae bacterium]
MVEVCDFDPIHIEFPIRNQDGKTMMLVPKAVNNPDLGGAPHVGGVALKNNGMTGDDPDGRSLRLRSHTYRISNS